MNMIITLTTVMPLHIRMPLIIPHCITIIRHTTNVKIIMTAILTSVWVTMAKEEMAIITMTSDNTLEKDNDIKNSNNNNPTTIITNKKYDNYIDTTENIHNNDIDIDNNNDANDHSDGDNEMMISIIK